MVPCTGCIMPSVQYAEAQLPSSSGKHARAAVHEQIYHFFSCPPARKKPSGSCISPDVLQVVLSALPFEDFVTARLCCRGWRYLAGRTAREVDLSVSLPVSPEDCSRKVQCLAKALPMLQSLQLKVTIHDGPSADSCLQEFLTCLRQTRNLAEKLLMLELESVVPPRLSWARHGGFPWLQALRITRPPQLQGLLTMPSARDIQLGCLAWLESLKELRLQTRCSLEMMQMLQGVTQLKALHILPLLWNGIDEGVNRYEWLSSLRQLHSLSICNHANLFDEDGVGVSWDEAQVLLDLPRLRRLCLRLSDVDVAEALCTMPSLTHLSLAYDGLDLPDFLLACQGSQGLSHLHLRVWNSVHEDQLQLLSNLTSLQVLHVCGPDDSTRPPVCSDLSALSRMHALRAFTYESGEAFGPQLSRSNSCGSSGTTSSTSSTAALSRSHSAPPIHHVTPNHWLMAQPVPPPLLHWLSHSHHSLHRLVLTLEDNTPLDMDLSALRSLTRLKELSLKLSPFAPVQPLHLPPNVTKLSLVASSYIKLMRPYALLHHLSPMQLTAQGALPELRHLELGRCALPRGLLAALAATHAPQLHTLIMRDVANMGEQDVVALAALGRLRHLHLTLNWQDNGGGAGRGVRWGMLHHLSRLTRLQHLHWRMTHTWGLCSQLGCFRIVDDFNCAVLVAHRTGGSSSKSSSGSAGGSSGSGSGSSGRGSCLAAAPKVQLNWLTRLSGLTHLDLFDHHTGRLITPRVWEQLQPYMPYLTYDDSY